VSGGDGSINQIYNYLKRYNKWELFCEIKEFLFFSGEELMLLDYIESTGFADLWRLAAVLFWLHDEKEYHIAHISLADDPEAGGAMFIIVAVDGCGKEDWKNVSKSIKDYLVKEGFGDIAGKIALVCRHAV